MVVYTIMIIELSQKLIQNKAYRLPWYTNLMFRFFGSRHGRPSSDKLSGPDFRGPGRGSDFSPIKSAPRIVPKKSGPKNPDQRSGNHGTPTVRSKLQSCCFLSI